MFEEVFSQHLAAYSGSLVTCNSENLRKEIADFFEGFSVQRDTTAKVQQCIPGRLFKSLSALKIEHYMSSTISDPPGVVGLQSAIFATEHKNSLPHF
jgi:hypothetical protein